MKANSKNIQKPVLIETINNSITSGYRDSQLARRIADKISM